MTTGYDDEPSCDFCGEPGGLAFSYPDDPDFDWNVCENCPTITEEYEID